MPCERKHIEAIERCFEHYAMLGNKESFKAVIAAISAALAACDESPWRSMESAPKDGATIDLYDSMERLTDCHWDAKRMAWVQWGNTGWGDSGWNVVEYSPTHWMPLPAAPEEKP